MLSITFLIYSDDISYRARKTLSAFVDDVHCLCHQMTKSVTCPEELGGLASQVTVDYGQLAHQGRLAAATAEPDEVRSHGLCLLENMGNSYMLVLYERFNTTSYTVSLYYCAPEMSDGNSTIGLHLTPKVLSDIFTHTLIRADVCFSLI